MDPIKDSTTLHIPLLDSRNSQKRHSTASWAIADRAKQKTCPLLNIHITPLDPAVATANNQLQKVKDPISLDNSYCAHVE